MLSKSAALANDHQVMINVLIYDSKLQKLQQYYTNDFVKVRSVESITGSDTWTDTKRPPRFYSKNIYDINEDGQDAYTL